MEMATASKIENNAFIVLIDSFLTAQMRLMRRHRKWCRKFAASAIRMEHSDWARQDSNLGPRDYESPALTAELQARLHLRSEV